MEVAELTAVLVAQVAAFKMNLASADAAVAGMRESLRTLETAAAQSTASLGRVKMTAAQAGETQAVLDTMKRSLSGTSATAIEASSRLHDVKMAQTQAAETRAVADEIAASNKKVRDSAIEAEVAQRRVGRGGAGPLAGILPGGARATPAALGIAGTVALGALPALGPGIVAPFAAMASMLPTIVGAAATLRLGGLDDISKAIQGDLTVFKQLQPASQQFVLFARSLQPLQQGLEDLIQSRLLPQLEDAIKTITSNPGAMSSIAGGFAAVASAIGGIARDAAASGIVQQIAHAMQEGAPVLRQFGDAVISVVSAWTALARAFLPLDQFFASMTQRVAAQIVAWTQNAVASGKMTSVISTMESSFYNVVNVVKALGDVLLGLARAVEPIATVGLPMLIGGLKGVAEWLGDNQKMIQNLVEGALKALQDAFKVITPIIEGVSNAVKFLTNMLGPTGLEVVLDALITIYLGKRLLAAADAAIIAIGKIGASFIATGVAATEGAAVADAELAGVGTAAATAAGEVNGLNAALLRVGGLTGIAAVAAGAAAVGENIYLGAQADKSQIAATKKYAEAGGAVTQSLPGGGYVSYDGKNFTFFNAVGGAHVIPGAPNVSQAVKDALVARYNALPAGGRSSPGTTVAPRNGVNLLQYIAGADQGMYTAQALPSDLINWSQAIITPRGTGPANLPWKTTGGGGAGPSATSLGTSALNLAVAGLTGPGATVAQLQKAIDLQTKYLDQLKQETLTKKNIVQVKNEEAALTRSIASEQARIVSLEQTSAVQQAKAQYPTRPGGYGVGSIFAMPTAAQLRTAASQAATSANQIFGAAELSMLGQAGIGSASDPATATLRRSLAAIQKVIADGTAPVSQTTKNYVAAIANVLKMGVVPSDVRQAISTELSNITAAIKTETDAAKALWKQTLSDMTSVAQTAVSDAQTVLDQAVSQLIAAANTAFDQQTNAAVKSMQDNISAHLAAMQIMVNSGAGSFLFGGGITQTPAQVALAQMQLAHQTQQNTLSLTQAQQALIAANAGGDPATIAAARRSVMDAQYAIQVAALQQQADTQSTAAAAQLKAAQDAYQKQQDALVQNYQDQRALQKEAMDQQLSDLQTLMKQYPELAQTYLGQMVQVFSQNGVPLQNASFVVGSQIYSGLALGLAPIYALINDLQAKLATLAGVKATPTGGIINIGPNVTPAAPSTYAQLAAMGGGATPGTVAYLRQLGGFAGGGSFVTSGPTAFLAGEGGSQETVTITPHSPGVQRGGVGGQPLALENHTHVYLDGREIMVSVRKEMLRFGRSNRSIFGGLA